MYSLSSFVDNCLANVRWKYSELVIKYCVLCAWVLNWNKFIENANTKYNRTAIYFSGWIGVLWNDAADFSKFIPHLICHWVENNFLSTHFFTLVREKNNPCEGRGDIHTKPITVVTLLLGDIVMGEYPRTKTIPMQRTLKKNHKQLLLPCSWIFCIIYFSVTVISSTLSWISYGFFSSHSNYLFSIVFLLVLFLSPNIWLQYQKNATFISCNYWNWMFIFRFGSVGLKKNNIQTEWNCGYEQKKNKHLCSDRL